MGDDEQGNPLYALLAIICFFIVGGFLFLHFASIHDQIPANNVTVNHTGNANGIGIMGYKLNTTSLDTNITIINKAKDYFSGKTTQGYIYNGTNLHIYNLVEVNKSYAFHFYDYAVVNNSIYGDVDLANEIHNVSIWHNNETLPTNETLNTSITILTKTPDNFTGKTTEGYLYNSTNLHAYNSVEENKTYPFHFYDYVIQNNTINGNAVLAEETNKTVVVHREYVDEDIVPFLFPWYMYSMYPWWYYYGSTPASTYSSSYIPTSDYGYGTGSYSYGASKAVEVPADEPEQVAQQEEQLTTEEQNTIDEENIQLNDEGYTNGGDPSENTIHGSTQEESAQDSSNDNSVDASDNSGSADSGSVDSGSADVGGGDSGGDSGGDGGGGGDGGE